MVNPGSFGKAQYKFLASEGERYSQGIKDGTEKDIMKDIIRRYFLYFPVEKPERYEPSEDEMKAVDTNTISPEVEFPELRDDECTSAYEQRVKQYEAYQKTFIYRRGVSSLQKQKTLDIMY